MPLLVVALILIGGCAAAQLSVFAPAARLPGQIWTLYATGKKVVRWDVKFNYESYSVDGEKLELPLVMPDGSPSGAAPLEIAAVLSNGRVERFAKDVALGSARDALIAEWIAIIQSENGTMRKSNSVAAPGQCKRYLINTFARASAQYAMSAAPDKPLAMPTEPNAKDGGRVYGCAWTLPSPFSGNPFFTAAEYDYGDSYTLRENKEAARALLESAQPGDVIQMMAVYNNGERGTHTLLVTEAYDSETDTLHWADSNFRMRVVDGVRYGIVEAEQSRSVDEVAGWLAQSNCAATIYRLSRDLTLRQTTAADLYAVDAVKSNP
jgi:hypothetical protein